jgi:zinc-ribbon domain
MSLTPCPQCGAAVPADSRTCPTCGASLAPVSYAAYRPAPPRPPEPERPWWRTGGGWLNAGALVVLVAGSVLVAQFLFRASADADRRKTEKAEVAREVEHLLAVSTWEEDTTGTIPVPASAGRPAPTSDLAKQMWVISRMVVDHRVWRQQVMARHGLEDQRLPAAWGTARYYANARAYPEVGRYVEGRAAAIAEIEKTSAAWMEGHVAALARESGMPAREIRDLLPPDFERLPAGEARLSNTLLEMHRQLVRMDPRVHHAAGEKLRYEREDDVRRVQAMEAEIRDVIALAERERQRKRDREAEALSRKMQ